MGSYYLWCHIIAIVFCNDIQRPSVVSSIVKGLKRKVKDASFTSINEAVGYKHI